MWESLCQKSLSKGASTSSCGAVKLLKKQESKPAIDAAFPKAVRLLEPLSDWVGGRILKLFRASLQVARAIDRNWSDRLFLQEFLPKFRKGNSF